MYGKQNPEDMPEKRRNILSGQLLESLRGQHPSKTGRLLSSTSPVFQPQAESTPPCRRVYRPKHDGTQHRERPCTSLIEERTLLDGLPETG